MSQQDFQDLSRRERQIMDVVYRIGQGTAADIHRDMDDAPSLNSVRRLIGILEGKGHLQHEWDGPRHVYKPIVPRNMAGKSALKHLTKTFFDGEAAQAMATLFDQSSQQLSQEDLEFLAEKIDSARKANR